jgi:hypothetical protein
MPLPPEAGTASEHCEKIPYKQIIDAALLLPGIDQAAFGNLVANPPYQVSTWHDPYYPDDQYGNPDDLDDYADSLTLDYFNVADWMPNGDGNMAASEITDGGLCHKIQVQHHICMEYNAYQIELDYDTCKAYDEANCEAEGCTWLAKGKCVMNMCLAEFTGDAKVTTKDYGILKAEYGRAGCPQ